MVQHLLLNHKRLFRSFIEIRPIFEPEFIRSRFVPSQQECKKQSEKSQYAEDPHPHVVTLRVFCTGFGNVIGPADNYIEPE